MEHRAERCGHDAISAELFINRVTVAGLFEKNEHRTSNAQHRMLNGKR